MEQNMLDISNSQFGSLSEGLMYLIVHTTIANVIVIGVCDYTKKSKVIYFVIGTTAVDCKLLT